MGDITRYSYELVIVPSTDFAMAGSLFGRKLIVVVVRFVGWLMLVQSGEGGGTEYRSDG